MVLKTADTKCVLSLAPFLPSYKHSSAVGVLKPHSKLALNGSGQPYSVLIISSVSFYHLDDNFATFMQTKNKQTNKTNNKITPNQAKTKQKQKHDLFFLLLFVFVFFFLFLSPSKVLPFPF